MPTKKYSPSFPLFILFIIISFFSGSFGALFTSTYLVPQKLVTKNIIEERRITYVEESSLIQAREKISPAVVSIVGNQEIVAFDPNRFFSFGPFGFGDPFNPFDRFENDDFEGEKKKQSVSAGTGFIIDSDGMVITNKHVVDNEKAEYFAILNDGTEYKAEIITKDPLNDLAILKLKPKDDSKKIVSGLPIVELGDSDQIKIGQRVLAIGNALAEYQNTTTSGIISATGRDIQASDTRGRGVETLTGLMQTDAAINPGNSGGPLVNLSGQVIGVNTAIASQANGIGFAIPINDIKPALTSLKKYGKIIRPILGVRYIILTKEKADELKIPVSQGALLIGNELDKEFAVIPGGPADKAGLQYGDVILEANGVKLDLEHTLQKTIRNKIPGDKIKLKIWRKDKTFETEVTLGEISDEKPLN